MSGNLSRADADFETGRRGSSRPAGSLVRPHGGPLVVAAIRPRRERREGRLGAAERAHRPRRARPRRRQCARSTRRRALAAGSTGKLGDVRYVYSRRDGERVFKVVSFFLLRTTGGRIGELPPGMEHRGRRGALAPARRRAALLAYTGEREMADARARRSCRQTLYIGRGRGDVRAELLLADRRGPAPLAPQDRDDPARRQVAAIQEGDDRDGARRRALRPAAADLRRRDRQGRREAPRRALAARDRARQPRDPAGGRACPLLSASSTTARSPRTTPSP